MKTIILFVLSLCLVNLSMAQCTAGSITYSGQATICENSYTGDFEASGGSSASIIWQRKIGSGSFVTVSFGTTGTPFNNSVGSAGTYKYRALWTNGFDECPSNEITITVQGASGGTLSISPAGPICTGGTPPTLTVTNPFGTSMIWEYQFNNSSWSPFGALYGPGSASAFIPSGAGQYNYRLAARCNASPFVYSNTVSLTVNAPTYTAAVCNDPDELRRAVAKVDISGIPYDFSGFLVNHSSQDGRLLFLTTSHPFMRYSPTQSALNNATFTWNEDLNSCGGSASQTVTSIGCKIKAIDGFFALLELNAAPAMPQGQLYYLGWDINATDNYSSIFQSASSIRKGKVVATGSPSTVSGSFATNSDNFNESSGSGVFKFTNWSGGNTEKQGRGAPLLAGPVGKKARGVYIGGSEANCGNGPSYFAYLSSSNTSLLYYLRDGSQTNTATVRMNYCKTYLDNLPSPLNSNETYQVTDHIISNQQISDGYVVRYKAGTFIELNDGFVSGTDFIAEIDPCVITRNIIAAKTDDVSEEAIPLKPISLTENIIKIYPTVLPSGSALKVEVTEGVKRVLLEIYDLQSKRVLQSEFHNVAAHTPNSISLTDLSSGLYIAKAIGDNVSSTQKIIVE